MAKVKPPDQETFHYIKNKAQAKALSDQKTFHHFSPFIAQDCSASEAAEEASCSLEAMLYRIKQFLNLDLLKIVREEKRAGRAIKVYRSSFDAYFIPFEMTPFASVEERLEHLFHEHDKDVIRSMTALLQNKNLTGQRVFRAPDGEVWRQSASTIDSYYDLADSEHSIGTQMIGETYLTQEEAREFQMALNQLASQYQKPYNQNRKTEGRDAYILSFTFVKLEPE